MYIPDTIERLEASAERWAENNITGNMFKCSCGKRCRLIDGQPIDSNPYAPPICMGCFEEWYDLEMKRKKNNES